MWTPPAQPPTRHTDHRQSISQNFSLKNPANNHCIIENAYRNAYISTGTCILVFWEDNMSLARLLHLNIYEKFMENFYLKILNQYKSNSFEMPFDHNGNCKWTVSWIQINSREIGFNHFPGQWITFGFGESSSILRE